MNEARNETMSNAKKGAAIVILVGAFGLGVAAPAAAQPATIAEPGDGARALMVGGRIDGAPGIFVAGALALHAGPLPGVSVAFADGTWIAGDADAGDARGRVGVELDLWRPRRLGLRARVAGVVTRAENPGFRAVGLGSELGLLAGWLGPSWSAAAELRWGATWATHLEHTPWYRDFVYDRVRDGWYGATGSTWHAGLRGGWRMRRVVVSIAGGWAHHGPLDLLPAVDAELGVGWLW